MAKVVYFDQLGGPEVLKLGEKEVGAPGPREVQIAVRALGLNRAEALFRSGSYIEQADLPSGIGLESAGIIESVGPEVRGFARGDRVAVIPPISMRERPVHAERLNYPAESVVALPDNQSFVEAAATWMAYLTAFGALVEVAELRSDESVVITAASSSVGLAAIQIVNALGGVPIAVTRNDSKRSALLKAGAGHVITSDDNDVAAALRGLTGPHGPRIILDAVGGRLLPQLISAAAAGGIILSYGAQDAVISNLPPASLLAKSLTLRGYLVHELIRDPMKLNGATAFILEHLSSGALRPTIARTFPLDDICAAAAFLESGDQIGKVVVKIK